MSFNIIADIKYYHVIATEDYDPSAITVRFEPNQSISCVLIDITDGNIFENSEEFNLVIVPPGGINVADDETTVTIDDDDMQYLYKVSFNPK